jgi:hypothetical protein
MALSNEEIEQINSRMSLLVTLVLTLLIGVLLASLSIGIFTWLPGLLVHLPVVGQQISQYLSPTVLFFVDLFSAILLIIGIIISVHFLLEKLLYSRWLFPKSVFVIGTLLCGGGAILVLSVFFPFFPLLSFVQTALANPVNSTSIPILAPSAATVLINVFTSITLPSLVIVGLVAGILGILCIIPGITYRRAAAGTSPATIPFGGTATQRPARPATSVQRPARPATSVIDTPALALVKHLAIGLALALLLVGVLKITRTVTRSQTGNTCNGPQTGYTSNNSGLLASRALVPMNSKAYTLVDLYRVGNSTTPRLEKMRPDQEYVAATGMVPITSGLSNDESLQTLQNLGFEGWVWKLPRFSCVPQGVHFVKDHDTHWLLAPTTPLSVAEYISIVTQPWFQAEWCRTVVQLPVTPTPITADC